MTNTKIHNAINRMVVIVYYSIPEHQKGFGYLIVTVRPVLSELVRATLVHGWGPNLMV